MKIGPARLRLLLLSIIGVLLLTACEFRVYVDLVIQEDESGSLTVELSMDEALTSLVGAEFGGELSVGEDLVPDGWNSAVVAEEGFEGIRATATFASLTALHGILSELAGMQDGSPDLGLLGFLASSVPSREGDNFRFRLTIPDALGGVLEEGLAEAPVPLELSLLDEVFDIRVRLMLPGDVVAHNADLDNGEALVWHLSLTDSGRTLEAESRLPQPGVPMVVVWVAVVAALIVMIVVVLLIRSRRKNAGGPEPGAEPSEASGQ